MPSSPEYPSKNSYNSSTSRVSIWITFKKSSVVQSCSTQFSTTRTQAKRLVTPPSTQIAALVTTPRPASALELKNGLTQGILNNAPAEEPEYEDENENENEVSPVYKEEEEDEMKEDSFGDEEEEP